MGLSRSGVLTASCRCSKHEELYKASTKSTIARGDSAGGICLESRPLPTVLARNKRWMSLLTSYVQVKPRD